MNDASLDNFKKKQCFSCSELFYNLFEFEHGAEGSKEKFYICKECRTELSLRWRGSVARNKFAWFDKSVLN
jgi:hypothetical protein